jgi:hypothetical protein
LAKDENGNVLADSHYILNRLKNYFNPLLNVHAVNDAWLIEMPTDETLVSELRSFFEVERAQRSQRC